MVSQRNFALIPIGRISGDCDMGLVIPFTPAERKTVRRTVSGAGQGAEILFFTGVRYFRREAPPADGGRPKGGRTGTRRAVKRRA